MELFLVRIGCVNYKHLQLPHPQVSYVASVETKDDLPLYTKAVKGIDFFSSMPLTTLLLLSII